VAQEVDGFAVQVGSFSQQDNAQQFADQLKKKGFAVFVTPGKTSAGTVFRVYAGPRSTRSAAENLAGVLKSAGYKTMVIELDANQSGSAR
jgi:cell division septation protein DedD